MGKRALDIVFGAVFALLAIPVIVIAAVGAAITFRAWPFFVQERIGFRGRPFRIVKIRTLPPDAPRYTDKYTVGLLPLPWFPRALRQLHLDELPQLFLVVLGQMSLVGPRPEMARLIPLMPQDQQVSREAFRPGCTGLWQVSVGAGGLIAEAPEYDRFYAAHARLSLDLFILVRTAVQLFRPSHRVSMATMPSWASRGVVCYASRARVLDAFIVDLTVADQRATAEPAGIAS